MPHRELQKEEMEKEHPIVGYRKRLTFWHTVRIVLRNSICAAVIRILYGIIKLLVRRGVSRAFIRGIPDEFLSLNPLKWAAVLAGFSSFRFCNQVISRVIPEKPAAFISGGICALPALVMNKPTRTDLCLYAFVRFVHTFALRYIMPHMPPPVRSFQHYDTLVMCLCSAQIGYSSVMAHNTMPKAYLKFLFKAAHYDDSLLRAYSGMLREYGCSPDLLRFCDRENFLPSYNLQECVERCCTYSGHVSCDLNALRFLVYRFFGLGLPLYGPLKIATTLGLQRKKLIRQPRQTITRAVKSVICSSLFISAYVTVVMRAACFCKDHHLADKSMAAMCGLCGLSTLLEPKNRRADLAFYCAMYGIRGFIMTQNRLGRIPFPRHWVVFTTYVLSMAFLFYEYEEEPDLVNSRVRFLFGLALGEKRRGGPRPGKSPAPSAAPSATASAAA